MVLHAILVAHVDALIIDGKIRGKIFMGETSWERKTTITIPFQHSGHSFADFLMNACCNLSPVTLQILTSWEKFYR